MSNAIKYAFVYKKVKLTIVQWCHRDIIRDVTCNMVVTLPWRYCNGIEVEEETEIETEIEKEVNVPWLSRDCHAIEVEEETETEEEKETD